MSHLLHIAADVTPLRDDGACGGAQPFVLDLLRELAANRAAPRLTLLTAAHNHAFLAPFDALGATRVRAETGLGGPPLRERGIDVLFCPMTAPTYAENDVPTVCTLYDLQHLAYPYFFSPEELAHRQRFYAELVRVAAHVVCISEFSRVSAIRHLGIPPWRTSVVPIAIHNRLTPPTSEAAVTLLSPFGVGGRRFLLYPANFWPHKNHRLLLIAFARFLREAPHSDLDLVLTGETLGAAAEWQTAVDTMGIGSRVHVLGYVSEAVLSALWSRAAALIFPSLYEGFGIPVAEALHLGTPVICSRAGSLPEVGGDRATYVDARNPQSLVDALRACQSRLDAGMRPARSYGTPPGMPTSTSVADAYLRILDAAARGIAEQPAVPSNERRTDGTLLSPAEAFSDYLEAMRSQSSVAVTPESAGASLPPPSALGWRQWWRARPRKSASR